MKNQKILIAVLGTMLIVGCGKKNKDDADDIGTYSVDEEGAMVAAATNAISSLAEDSDTSTVQSKSSEQQAASSSSSICGRVAAAQACVNGTRLAAYDNCLIPFTDVTATGSVALAYTNNACRLSVDGDSVSRTFDVTLVGPRNGRYIVKSENRTITDFFNGSQSAVVGGGGQLTKTAAGWNASVNGKHIQILGWQGEELVNMSIRTPSSAPIVIQGTLSRTNRTIASGSLEVFHNRAKYGARFSAVQLKYNSSCCHPVSGKLVAEYMGSITGAGEIQFNSCGSATLTKQGAAPKEISLGSCE